MGERKLSTINDLHGIKWPLNTIELYKTLYCILTLFSQKTKKIITPIFLYYLIWLITLKVKIKIIPVAVKTIM